MLCPICKREMNGEFLQFHHLIPKAFKGKEGITIHKVCHQKIHSVFTERELLHYYHTVERITSHDEIKKFIKWIRKKPGDFYDKNDETKRRYGKRKK